MIPYFEQPRLQLGPIAVHSFGLLVAGAVLAGMAIVRRRTAREGLDPETAQRLVGWALVLGFLTAHFFDRLVYFPRETLNDPASLFRIWESLSSFGGFLGGVAGLFVVQRRLRLGRELWRYLDTIAYAFPFGWVLGRLGCFTAYDHPGSPTTFVLAQRYRDGVVRHNLGLDEALYSALLAALFWALGRRPRRAGFFVGLLAVLYAPVRFALDFLRKIDVRYLRLTPGQYGSVALAGVGLLILWRSRLWVNDRPSQQAQAASSGTASAESSDASTTKLQ
jgi:phosphatidylglycerol---prolipoprotein diacylglyceryl transferase